MKQLLFKTATCWSIAICFSFGFMLTSCSSDDEEEEAQQPMVEERPLCQLTIDEVPLTRATLTDNDKTLGAAWKEGDNATYMNLSSFSSLNIDYGTLTAASSAASSSFTGGVRCQTNDHLMLIYPATDPILTGTDRGKFTISLAGQAGTLADLATRFHYVYGVGTVTSVTGNQAHATISGMKSLLAACKFTFKDGGDHPIPVKTLSISYRESLSAGLPQTYALATNTDPAQVAIPENLSPSGEALSIDLTTQTSEGVYVALFPIDGQQLFFSVTNSAGTYTGTATAKLKAGKFYPATLTLTKQP